MSDFAINYNTGDFLISPRNDLALRTGRVTVDQRIRVRLRIRVGEWLNDPSEGTLGSRLKETFNIPTWRAAQELELVIREALEPMEDIQIQTLDVTVDPKDARQVNVRLTYAIAEDDAEVTQDDIISLDTTITAGV